MATRAERLIAQMWRHASARKVCTEAFLEEALAAALEHPEVWSRVVAALHWDLPPGRPVVTTQQVVDTGRTDILLTWPSGYRLVLELKVEQPPSPEQVRAYLRPDTDVAAVAKFPALLPIVPPAGCRFLGVVTWRRLRSIDWPEAPLVLRQLHHLLDATEVAVSRITLSALSGMPASWGAWDAFDAWALKAAEAVQQVFAQAGLPWVTREQKLGPIDATHARWARWAWPRPWRWHLGAYTGLFMGRDKAPTQLEELPDLVLALHTNPESPIGQALRTDGELRAAVERWARRDGGLAREWLPPDSGWEFLRVRESAVGLLAAPDQATAFLAWMTSRAQEWRDDGVLSRFAQLVASAGGRADGPGSSPAAGSPSEVGPPADPTQEA